MSLSTLFRAEGSHFKGNIFRRFLAAARWPVIMILIVGASAVPALAGEAQIDSGDTAWILVSTALVMLMIPGLGLFYAGMARGKNVLATIMHSFFILCLISIQWVVWGYSLSFGTDILGGLSGGLSYFGLNGVGSEANGTIPHYTFMMQKKFRPS